MLLSGLSHQRRLAQEDADFLTSCLPVRRTDLLQQSLWGLHGVEAKVFEMCSHNSALSKYRNLSVLPYAISPLT